jgi:hypothetical protein
MSEVEPGAEMVEIAKKRATSGKDTIAGIFWLKARAGWVDTVKQVHEGIPENITVTFALEPPEEKPELIDVTPRKEIEN